MQNMQLSPVSSRRSDSSWSVVWPRAAAAAHLIAASHAAASAKVMGVSASG
jgi:hypothetical protein